VIVLGEAHLDTQLRQHVLEEGVRASVEERHRHDVRPRLGDREDRVVDRRAPGAEGQCGDPALEGGDPLFKHCMRGVHDPGVDVALDLQVEEVRAVLGVVELVRHGLVDRDRYRLGGGIGRVSGVDGDRLVFHVVALLEE
jgi:hypothetical protein